MSLPTGLIEALTGAGVLLVGSVAASGLAALLSPLFAGRGRIVALKFPSGKKVQLDLDEGLSADQVNRLIARTVESVKAGDENALKAVVEDSHSASVKVRATGR